jgi:hypothetical protein
MIKLKYLFFSFSLLLALSPLAAQSQNQTADIVLPFELRNHVILVPCYIDDAREPYFFIVDTGGLSMVDKRLADELKLKQLGQQAKISSLKIGDFDAGKVIFFTQFDFSQFRNSSGLTVQGMIGSDFLEDYVVTIDYDKRQLTLSSNPETLAQKQKENPTGYLLKFKQHPVNHAPLIPFSLPGNSPAMAMVDTGQPYSLVLPLDYLEKTGVLKEKSTRKAKGVIVKWPGTTHPDNYLTRLKSISLGNLAVAEPITVFAELPRMLSMPLLGKNFLAQYLITIDYPRLEILLQPRAAKHGSNQLFSMGLQVHLAGENRLEVRGVWEKSPADRAQIEVGDFILEFNGREASPEHLQEFWLLLNDATVKEIELKIAGKKGTRKLLLKKESLI